jgi:hypothetical protein
MVASVVVSLVRKVHGECIDARTGRGVKVV